MFFAIVSICRSTIGQFFSLSLVTVPEVFAKVNSAQFSSPLFSATLETKRKLGRVNYRKDFWDCYWEQEKKLANS